MRFYTVPDAKEARKSVLYATSFIGYFYLIIPIVGFTAACPGAQGAHSGHRQRGQHGRLLAETAGRNALHGFIAAVAFATILAVVAGLTWRRPPPGPRLVRQRVPERPASEAEQVRVAKLSTVISAWPPSPSASRSRGRTWRSWSAWRLPSRAAGTSPPCSCPSPGGDSPPRRGDVILVGPCRQPR